MRPVLPNRVRNVAGQRNYGLELELTWFPTDELQIGVMASWLDAAYTSFFTQVNSGADFSASPTPECFDIDEVGNDDAVELPLGKWPRILFQVCRDDLDSILMGQRSNA